MIILHNIHETLRRFALLNDDSWLLIYELLYSSLLLEIIILAYDM